MERSSVRILVIDDDLETREIVCKALHDAGFQSTAVGSADEARQNFSKNPHHLVLMDLNVPDGHGLTLIEELRTQEAPPAVIILTGSPSVSSAAAGMRHGVRNYLTKPIPPQALVDAVETELAKDGLLIDSDERFLAELGKRLKTARQGAELTMRSLGDRVGISQAQISQIEAGLSAPSLTTLFRLSRALKTRMSHLFDGF